MLRMSQGFNVVFMWLCVLLCGSHNSLELTDKAQRLQAVTKIYKTNMDPNSFACISGRLLVAAEFNPVSPYSSQMFRISQ